MSNRREVRGMRFVGLGLEFAAAVAGLTLFGYWIDARLETQPWGLLIGAGVGLVGGMYNMVRVALSAVKPEEPRTENDGTHTTADEP